MMQPGQKATGSAGDDSLVVRAGSLLCALRLDEVIETMRPLATHPLAGTPPFVTGICIMRGVPTLVIDVARLLGGTAAPVTRFVAVRTEQGPVACAIGDILGVRPITTRTAGGHEALLGSAAAGLISAVGTLDAAPVLMLRSMRLVPDEVWAAAAGTAVPA
jgi:purine-binding chemotaxis protein CheW